MGERIKKLESENEGCEKSIANSEQKNKGLLKVGKVMQRAFDRVKF